MPSVFISKNANEINKLQSFCSASGFSLIARSMIGFEPVPFGVKSDFDVVFFSSPRSVMFFLREFSPGSKTKIAAVGDKTAELLSALGYTVDFIGAGDPQKTSSDFREWVGDKRVLFPISSNSLRSISKDLKDDQKEEVVVYETIPTPSTVQPCDIYFFTSPSNVNAFMAGNELPSNKSKVFAWGSSTSSALKEEGLEHTVMSKPSISEVINILQQLI
jgi:uroporphyrinogen-III synthase